MDSLKIENQSLTLVDLVEQKLLSYFKKNQLKPGDGLPGEIELAKALGVGRSVLREALSRFKMLGLVETRTRRGMILGSPNMIAGISKVVEPTLLSMDHIKEILGFRIALEIGNSYAIVKNCTQKDLEELQMIVSKTNVGQFNQFSAMADYEFHAKLYAIGGNNVICNYQEIFYRVFVFIDENFQQYFRQYNDKKKKDTFVNHQQLLDVLKTKDIPAFEITMRKHLQLYIDFIDEN